MKISADVPEHIILQSKTLNKNLSSIVRDLLVSYFDNPDQNKEINILKQELKDLNNEKDKILAKISIKEVEIKNFKQTQEQKKEQDLWDEMKTQRQQRGEYVVEFEDEDPS